MIEYPVLFRGHTVVFAVDNPLDAIQSHHVRGQFYEEEELDYLRTIIPPRVNVADAGANVGNHAIFFSQVCRAERVFAFEANPAAIELLKKNVAVNSAAVDLSQVGVALGGRDGFVDKLPNMQTNNMGSTSFAPSPSPTAYPMTTLDSALNDRPIDFLKIDVEGMEFEVMAGAMTTIHRHRPILFVEVRRHELARFSKLMAEMNYRIERSFQRYKGIFTLAAGRRRAAFQEASSSA